MKERISDKIMIVLCCIALFLSGIRSQSIAITIIWGIDTIVWILYTMLVIREEKENK